MHHSESAYFADRMEHFKEATNAVTEDITDLVRGTKIPSRMDEEKRMPPCIIDRVEPPNDPGIGHPNEPLTWRVIAKVLKKGKVRQKEIVFYACYLMDIEDIPGLITEAYRDHGFDVEEIDSLRREDNLREQFKEQNVDITLQEEFRRLLELKLDQYQERLDRAEPSEDMYSNHQAYKLRLEIGRKVLETRVFSSEELAIDMLPEIRICFRRDFLNSLKSESKIMKRYSEKGGEKLHYAKQLPSGTKGVPEDMVESADPDDGNGNNGGKKRGLLKRLFG